jgi:hypothetical protein
VNLFFFGEGTANLDLYRKSAVDFLNDGSADPTTATQGTQFSALPVTSAANTAYDTRVRGLVSLLLTTQRFQEQ